LDIGRLPRDKLALLSGQKFREIMRTEGLLSPTQVEWELLPFKFVDLDWSMGSYGGSL
jgi:hypothetical protein